EAAVWGRGLDDATDAAHARIHRRTPRRREHVDDRGFERIATKRDQRLRQNRIANPSRRDDQDAFHRPGSRLAFAPLVSAATCERAAFQAITCAAIRAHRFACHGDVEENARMTRPERHPRVRAEDGKLPRFDEDGFAIASLGHHGLRYIGAARTCRGPAIARARGRALRALVMPRALMRRPW